MFISTFIEKLHIEIVKKQQFVHSNVHSSCTRIRACAAGRAGPTVDASQVPDVTAAPLPSSGFVSFLQTSSGDRRIIMSHQTGIQGKNGVIFIIYVCPDPVAQAL